MKISPCFEDRDIDGAFICGAIWASILGFIMWGVGIWGTLELWRAFYE